MERAVRRTTTRRQGHHHHHHIAGVREDDCIELCVTESLQYIFGEYGDQQRLVQSESEVNVVPCARCW